MAMDTKISYEDKVKNMISIVLPVYNAEKYLRKCIESVIEQTYPVWELIIIDNGSEDGSYHICQEYAKKEERILLLHQYQNKGVSVARNLGVEKATGHYVTFLDADDWVAKDYLEQLIKIAKETQSDMVVCNFQKIYDADREVGEEDNINNTESGEMQKQSSIQVYQQEEYIQQCLLNGYTHCWGVLYKLSLLEGIRFPAGITIGEDVLFLIDAVLRAENIVVTEYDGYYYYINEHGAMNRKFTLSYMDQILCWKKAKEKLLGIYPKMENKINSILVVSTMLVVGKLAALSKEELAGFGKELEECRNVIKEFANKGKVIRLLPSGYGLKVRLFKISPALYLKLYGAWKS